LHLSESTIIHLGIFAEEKNQCPSAATFKVEPAIRTIVPRFAAAPHGGHHSCRVQRPVNALAMNIRQGWPATQNPLENMQLVLLCFGVSGGSSMVA